MHRPGHDHEPWLRADGPEPELLLELVHGQLPAPAGPVPQQPFQETELWFESSVLAQPPVLPLVLKLQTCSAQLAAVHEPACHKCNFQS